MGTVKYSGPVASFHCPTNAEIRSLKVHFSPKQEGTGDPSPENVRPIVGWEGVEVYNNNNGLPKEYQQVKYIERNEGGAIISIDYQELDMANCEIYATFTILGPASGERAYMGASATYGRGNAWEIYFPMQKWRAAAGSNQIIVNGDITTLGNTGSIHVIMDDISRGLTLGQYRYGAYQSSNRIHYCRIEKNGSILREMFPCYRKLDNKPGMYDIVTNTFYINTGLEEFICGPDVGKTTDYEFGVLGKNKFDYANANIKNSKRLDDNGNETNDPYASYSQLYTPVVPSTQYTISGFLAPRNSQKRLYYFDKNKTFISRSVGYSQTTANPFTIITPENCYYVQIQLVNDVDGDAGWATLQLELGSTATAYEPYDPNKTVYGGWVDLVSGEVCETYSLKTFNGSEQQWLWSQSSYGIPYIAIDSMKSGTWYSDVSVICDTAIKVNASSSGALQCLIGYNNNRIYFYNTTSVISGVTDLNSFTNWLSTNNISITYPLETPQIYQLAPIAMQTFLSHNNIWSNVDYVEVEYDLHETQDILARKQFIIANQPHVVTPAAAPLQNFVTDVPAPLKECKVHFAPVQDLHGYDKPWVGGSGKNLFNINATEQNPSDTTPANTTLRIFTAGTYAVGTSWSNWWQPNQIISYSINNNILTIQNNNVYGIGFAFKLTPENTYTISATSTNGGISVSYYDVNGNYITTTSSNMLNTAFTVPTEANITLLTFYSRITSETATFANIQLELGSTATTYEPYENICPISGWNGMEIYRAGKNLFGGETLVNKFSEKGVSSNTTNKTLVYTGSQANSVGRLFDKFDNGQYSIILHYTSTNESAPNANMRLWYKDGSYLSISTNQAIENNGDRHRFLTNSNKIVDYLEARWVAGTTTLYYEDCGIFKGNVSLSDFVSYSNITIPITFPTEAGTIYGGYVDLVTGEVWKTYFLHTIDGNSSPNKGSSYYDGQIATARYFWLPAHTPWNSPHVGSTDDAYCDKALSVRTNIWSKPDQNIGAFTLNSFNQLHVIFDNEQIGLTDTSIADRSPYVKNWLADHPMTFVLPLRYPVLVATLTPTQLKTLRGTNNIWASNGGDNIEIAYWKH